MSTTINGNGSIWKPIALVLISALIAGSAFFLTMGTNKIDRAEAINLINTNSPYLEDRRLLNTTLVDMGKSIKDQGKAINSICSTQAAQTQAITSMAAEQGRLNERVDDAIRTAARNKP